MASHNGSGAGLDMIGLSRRRAKRLPLAGARVVMVSSAPASAADVSGASPPAMPVKAQAQSLDQPGQATFNTYPASAISAPAISALPQEATCAFS